MLGLGISLTKAIVKSAAGFANALWNNVSSNWESIPSKWEE